MKHVSDEEVLMEQARSLASSCKHAGVRDYQVSWVLAHLQRHRDVAASRALLGELVRSCFSNRSKSSRKQFEALDLHVGQALAGQRDWERVARLLGWTRRWMVILGGR